MPLDQVNMDAEILGRVRVSIYLQSIYFQSIQDNLPKKEYTPTLEEKVKIYLHEESYHHLKRNVEYRKRTISNRLTFPGCMKIIPKRCTSFFRF